MANRMTDEEFLEYTRHMSRSDRKAAIWERMTPEEREAEESELLQQGIVGVVAIIVTIACIFIFGE